MRLPTFLNIVIFFSFIWGNSCTGNYNEQKILFSKVSVGMTEDEVLRILGKPDSVIFNKMDNDKSYYYFLKNQPLLSSGYPEIGFDSLGKVKLVAFEQ